MNTKQGLLILLIMNAWSTVYCTKAETELVQKRDSLIQYILYNKYAEAERLLTNGLNPNFTTPSHTPLMMVVFMNYSFNDKKKFITLLLAHRADINLPISSNGYNPLFYAIGMNDVTMVEFLLEQGANPLYGKVEIGKDLEVNALEYAHHLKHTAIVDLLEKYGAAMNDQTHIDNTIDEFERATGI